MTGSEEVRARILEKAGQRFLAQGYSRVTMDELCGELGMSKKTLYRVFPSKEALGEAVLVSRFARIGEELAAIHQDTRLDFGERISRFLRTLAGHYARGATTLEDIQRESPGLWRKLLEARRRAVQTNFGALFTAGVEAGAFRADVEPRLVIRMVLTLVDQLMRPDVLEELGMSGDQLFTRMQDVVLHGVRTGSEPRPRQARTTTRSTGPSAGRRKRTRPGSPG